MRSPSQTLHFSELQLRSCKNKPPHCRSTSTVFWGRERGRRTESTRPTNMHVLWRRIKDESGLWTKDGGRRERQKILTTLFFCVVERKTERKIFAQEFSSSLPFHARERGRISAAVLGSAAAEKTSAFSFSFSTTQASLMYGWGGGDCNLKAKREKYGTRRGGSCSTPKK